MTEVPYAVEHDLYAYLGKKQMERNIDDHLKIFLPPKLFLWLRVLKGEVPKGCVQVSSEGGTVNKVGIIGAGAGGLYTALILDSLGIPYEILEASERTGGRLYTHHFEKGTGTHTYYDVGAMRFPDIKAMRRLFELFKYEPLNNGKDNLNDKLIPYHFKPREAAGGYLLYNEVCYREAKASALIDPFHAKEYLKGNPDASAYITAGVDLIISDAIKPFTDLLLDDLKNGGDKGWKNLIKYDSYSFRGYLSHAYKPSRELLEKHTEFPDKPLPSDVINWVETMDTSSGSYDAALAEAILDAIAFGRVGPQPVEWKCLDGGSQVLSDSMKRYLQGQNHNCILFSKKVTSIRLPSMSNPEELASEIEVQVTGEDSPRTYSHVISTIPLTCLRTLDLTGCKLSIQQMNAMRQLFYGPSIKIGILFKSAWWSRGPGKITGGQSFTDRPIRTVVYPSYGLEKGPNETHVLIASYCWTEDATRLGALINTGAPTVDKELTHIVLRDLAAVHGVDIDMLENEFVDIFPYDWTHNPLSMGAFAFFGPGSFSTLYKTLNLPAADGRLHFASEALSTRHAWVVGALNSAWRAVEEMLLESSEWSEKLREFYTKWGIDQEWIAHNDPSDGGKNVGTLAQPDLLYKSLIIHRSELFH